MNRLKQLTVMSWVVGLLVLSCTHPTLRDINGLGGAEVEPGRVDETSSSLDAWEKLETRPGEPGVDYNPLELLVVYKPNPLPLPLGLQGVGVGTSANSGAASMPNQILRVNRQFEPLTDAIAYDLGLSIRQQVYQGNINAASFRLADGMDGDVVLAMLRQRFAGQVEHAVYSPLHHAAYIPDDPDFMEGPDGRQWELWRVGCAEAWDYERGDESVLIGLVDTGVRITHDELAGQVLDPQVHFGGYALDVYHNDNTVEDLQGHGTFIAGLVVAAGDNGNTITGVAPGCRVIPVKITDDMSAETLDVVAGCLLAFNLGAKVINISFGTDVEIPIEQDMVNQIWEGGAVLVSVAGNFGDDTIQYPGAFENAICVGGTNKADTRWENSNFGPTVNVAAPAMNLRSCTNNANDRGYYSNGSGTSYSAGIVSGALGLLFSLGPDVTNVMALQALENTGLPVAGFSGDVNRIDAGQAVWELVSNNVAAASQLNISPEVCGKAVEEYYLGMSIQGATKVAKVIYTLDLAPLGTIDENDPVVASFLGPEFSAQLLIPQDSPNQQARVLAEYYSSYHILGGTLEQDVLIYNLLGDTNSDGSVNGLDVEYLQTKIGLTDSDPGFTIFADTNLDGVINELDLAWVGYSWDG